MPNKDAIENLYRKLLTYLTVMLSKLSINETRRSYWLHQRRRVLIEKFFIHFFIKRKEATSCFVYEINETTELSFFIINEFFSSF